MTYRELFYKATRLINHHQITLGEYEEMTKPLDKEVEQEPTLDKITEIKKMTFEEVKEMFKKSIDTTDNMNQAIESLIQSVYLKGYNDALKHAE